MIRRERQTSLFYYVGDKVFPTLAAAQMFDLLGMMPDTLESAAGAKEAVATWLLANAGAVARILVTTPRSRNRKPRKDKGVPRVKRVEEVKP